LLIDARFQREYTNAEIADFLFCSADRIKKRIQRGIARLRLAADASDPRSTSPPFSPEPAPVGPSDLPGIPHSDRWVSRIWANSSPSHHECEARLRRLSIEQQIIVLNDCEGRSSQESANFFGLDPDQFEELLASALHSLRNHEEP
jgi:DNA-directed RNA polymerase specialized sigma24 family protein